MAAPATPRDLLADRLGRTSEALPFAEAVVAQLTGAAGAMSGAPEAARLDLAREVAELLLSVRSGDQLDDAFSGPELAAAFFQNIDLLYLHGWAHADGVSALIMAAIAAGEDAT